MAAPCPLGRERLTHPCIHLTSLRLSRQRRFHPRHRRRPCARAATTDDDPPGVTEPCRGVGVAGYPQRRSGLPPSHRHSQPAGTLTYNNYELLIHGLTYGINEHTQVTSGAGTVTGTCRCGDGSLKSRVLDAGRFHSRSRAPARW